MCRALVQESCNHIEMGKKTRSKFKKLVDASTNTEEPYPHDNAERRAAEAADAQRMARGHFLLDAVSRALAPLPKNFELPYPACWIEAGARRLTNNANTTNRKP